MEFDYEITEKSEFYVLGMALERIPFMQGPKHIPQLWQKFAMGEHPCIGEIGRFSVEPHGEFGVMKDFDQETKTFKYLAGLPVGSDASVPDGMEKWTIPAQTYIAVKCRLSTIMQAIEFWKTWISDSEEYEYSKGVEFEWYPPDYHEAPEKNWMYYCFPIRKKK
ncbi:MAG: GyrI-like domain-containing protein [Candidatus Bathyarchaeota archaeon]|jgi:predicted transcriptional regulator YdeE